MFCKCVKSVAFEHIKSVLDVFLQNLQCKCYINLIITKFDSTNLQQIFHRRNLGKWDGFGIKFSVVNYLFSYEMCTVCLFTSAAVIMLCVTTIKVCNLTFCHFHFRCSKFSRSSQYLTL